MQSSRNWTSLLVLQLPLLLGPCQRAVLSLISHGIELAPSSIAGYGRIQQIMFPAHF